MSLASLLSGSGPSGFGYGSTAEEVTEGLDLHGRTMLVTGCNSGLGQETMRVLALRGARVLAAARTMEKAEAATRGLSGEFVPLACELSEPASVRACVEAVQGLGFALDAIIANAGIMALPELQKAHGYELQFFTNHIGHFILITGLLDRLADRGRVVVLSSEALRAAPKGGIDFDNLDGARGYSPWGFYGQSKLANLLFTKQLAKRLQGTRKTANAVHPGVIDTNLSRSMHPAYRLGYAVMRPLFLKTIPQGAATQTYVATHPRLEGVSGEFFSHCNLKKSPRIALDAALAERLWDESERIVARL